MIDPILKFHKQRNENDKARRIKAAFTSPRLSNAAQCVASIIANKPAAPMPVLRGLVNKTTSKSASALERCIQSLKDQLKKTVASNKSIGTKKSRATGRINQRASYGTRALPPPQRNLPPRNLPPRNLLLIKMLPTKIPRAPKKGRNQGDEKSHSMGRRPSGPPACTNRALSGKGD